MGGDPVLTCAGVTCQSLLSRSLTMICVCVRVCVCMCVCVQGIMLVYDVTTEKSFENIRNWIRNIEEVSEISDCCSQPASQPASVEIRSGRNNIFKTVASVVVVELVHQQ